MNRKLSTFQMMYMLNGVCFCVAAHRVALVGSAQGVVLPQGEVGGESRSSFFVYSFLFENVF
jgi:hypothetical protein